MAALKFLAIVRLLLVISPRHEMNMTHTKSLNLKRHGYIEAHKEKLRFSQLLPPLSEHPRSHVKYLFP